MTDLSKAMNAAALRVRKPHIEAIIALGVSWRTIGTLGQYQAPFGVMTGTVADTGLFEPGDGPARVVQPVIVGGTVIDIVAWRTMCPDRWHLMTGLGWCMGEDALCPPPGHPVLLHSTPLDWLASGGAGACVLDWSAPEVGCLRHLDEIEVASPELGKLLAERISQSTRLPRITRKAAHHDQAA